MIWKGLIAATFTPMHPNGDPALESIPDYARRLCSDGCTGVYVGGSTGEGPSLTTEERGQLAEAWVKAAGDRLFVIVQVGHNSIREARLLASHAQDIGAAAFSATPPAYFPLAGEEDLMACMADIASAAPELPFYYYHIPMRTHVVCDVARFFEDGPSLIPGIKGVKFSDYRQFELQRAVDAASDRFDVFTGVDEMLLGSLSIGVNGAVGTTYNFAAPLYNRIVEAYRSGKPEVARETQSLAVNMISAVTKTCGLAGFKVVMELAGFDCGPTRLPLRSPSKAQRRRLEKKLKAMRFFEQVEEARRGSA